jgi:AcrR family transcriptional regulator
VADGGVHVSEIQRSRLLVAAVGAIDEFGYEAGSVARITERARVSRRTFYELFENREECLLAVLENTVQRLQSEILAADPRDAAWRDRVRGGLWVILSFFDHEPGLARVCLIQAQRASNRVLVYRQEILDQLARIVNEGHKESPRADEPAGLTGQGVVGSVVQILYVRLLRAECEPLRDLLGDLMAIIVLPYLGSQVARRERNRPLPPPITVPTVDDDGLGSSRIAFDQLAELPMRLTYRTALVLQGIAEHPGSSNRQVADHAGIHDQGQVSKLLTRLQRLGLLTNTANDAHGKGEANKWCLTTTGMQVTSTINTHAGRTHHGLVAR